MGNENQTDLDFNEIIVFLAELQRKLKIIEEFNLDE